MVLSSKCFWTDVGCQYGGFYWRCGPIDFSHDSADKVLICFALVVSLVCSPAKLLKIIWAHIYQLDVVSKPIFNNQYS